MHPFYFGSSTQRLIGIYDAAGEGSARKTGIVLCPPSGHEHIRSYRTFRHLAAQLAGVGYEVLRFDYYGSGDSAGEGDECTIEQCLQDVATAIDELKDMSGVERVTLLGLRVGATLAAFAAANRTDIDRLVLWDPVVSGRRYLEDMQRVEEAWLRQRPGGLGKHDGTELFGFPLTPQLRLGLEAMDIRSVPRWSSKHVYVLVSDERADDLAWREHLTTLPVPSTYRVVPGGGDWESPGSINRALLAHSMLQTIVELMR